MGLSRHRSGTDHREEHPAIAVEHTPGAHEGDQPQQEGEVGVPRVGQHLQSVSADGEGQDRRHRHGDHGPSPPVGDPEDERGGRRADHHAGQLHAPGRRSDQPVDRGDEIEAPRARVAALVGEAPDPSRQPDQRRVGRPDVAHPELGHRHVEHRVPGALAQHHGRHQQRDDHDRGHDPPGWKRRSRLGRRVGVGHGRSIVGDRPGPGRAGMDAPTTRLTTANSVTSCSSENASGHPPFGYGLRTNCRTTIAMPTATSPAHPARANASGRRVRSKAMEHSAATSPHAQSTRRAHEATHTTIATTA